ncbi:MAG: hypothetical protein V7756_10670 [Halopseudomonas sp.]|uniref:hypothetical protein n=1 Tax=Halopseudomonas sp. TaxID=2901191 RepID=UPI0030012E6F
MPFKEEEANTFQTEPDFAFCWSLAWRLVLLSVAIGILPLLLFNLCVNLALMLTLGFTWLPLLVGNTLIVIGAFCVSLKILLSRSFNHSFIRFYSQDI